ncbi:MAG: alpha/beta hydrolase [Euzebyaceae bacterium]|nr:alpha/beta hydrolase [Euzebyaceae bacterium]
MTAATVRAGTVRTNGAELYYERRGQQGPAVLCVTGASGDAGVLSSLADRLADEYTVVTYDRRGNSRSPRPSGWTATFSGEQARDAAGLVEGLGLAPVTVFGSSGGAIIALWLLLECPDLLAGAVLHEPPLIAALAEPEPAMAAIQSVFEPALMSAGPRGGMEAFLRCAAGDAAFEALDPQQRDRQLGNGETFFGVELGALESALPDHDRLAAVTLPVRVLAGVDTAPLFAEAAAWVAARLGVAVTPSPGAHTPYFDRPDDFAATVRSCLREVAGAATPAR